MKICYTNFHQHEGGGHTTYVVALARALAPRHTIWVIAPPTSRIYREVGSIPGVQRAPMVFSSKVFHLLKEIRRLRALLREQAFDVVHVNGSADHRYLALATAGLGPRRPRIVFTKHNDLNPRTLGNALRARLCTDRVICVSESTRQLLKGSAYEKQGLRVIRNGVDTDHYHPWTAEAAAAARREFLPRDSGEDAIVIGSNAGVAPHKGWFDMVRAVADVPVALRARIYILLAGQPFTDQEKADIEALGLAHQVIHAGLLVDVRPFLAALDLGFVLSYRVETISFACREMMAMGKPVIVSDSGGLSENITAGQDGWIVPARHPASVSELLVTLLANPDLLSAAAKAARAKSVAEFSMTQFTQATEEVYQELAR